MRKALVVLILMVASFGGGWYSRQPKAALESAEPFFSPRGGCTAAVVKELDNLASGDVLLVQAFSFTSKEIGDAIIKAHKQGAEIHVLVDKSQRSERSMADEVLAAGVELNFDEDHAIAHNKIMVIYRFKRGLPTVITGSFNFTANAEKSNAENLLIIHSDRLASRYRDNFYAHWRHGKAAK